MCVVWEEWAYGGRVAEACGVSWLLCTPKPPFACGRCKSIFAQARSCARDARLDGSAPLWMRASVISK